MAVGFLGTAFTLRTTPVELEGDSKCARTRTLLKVPRNFGKLLINRFPSFKVPGLGLNPKVSDKKDESPDDLLNVSALSDRTVRLQHGKVKILFHQTTMEACKAIVETGFRIGSDAHWGPGIYGTTRKSDTFKLTTSRGCIIKYEARVGNISDNTRVDAYLYALLSKMLHRNFKGPKLIKKGIDSVHGCWCGMDEWVVYFPDQAVVLEACPTDKQGNQTGPCMKPATRMGAERSSLID
jgi:hypothetical protein